MKINGPVNIIRLEGIIFNIKKILYIYFDHHYSLDKQTKCDGYINDDIVTFFNKEFLKINDKTIDFFMETSFDQETDLLKNIKYKDRYIDEVNKFFISNILIKNNKNIGTKINSNIRFHYIDVRYEFKTISFYKIFNEIKKNINNNENYSNYINEIINELNKLKKIIELGDNKIIYKLKEKYFHLEIKDKIKILLNKLNTDIDNLKIIISNIKTIKNADKSYLYLLQLYSWLMDIYFLRRFLDKNYVINALIYCGSGHAIRYIYFLIKHFDFKITNSSYLAKPIGLVNKILQNYSDDNISNDVNIISLFNNSNNIQCIDISSFPENFS